MARVISIRARWKIFGRSNSSTFLVQGVKKFDLQTQFIQVARAVLLNHLPRAHRITDIIGFDLFKGRHRERSCFFVLDLKTF